MKVMAGFAEKRTEKKRGCGKLPAELEAGQESTKNNSLHVKGNFKSADVAVSGLFSFPAIGWAQPRFLITF